MFWRWRQRQAKERQRSAEELQQAHEEAQAIIAQAAQKAEQIIREAHFFTRQVREDLKRSLQTTTEGLAQQSYAHVEEVINHYEAELRKVFTEVKAMAAEELQVFNEETRKNLSQLEEDLKGAAVSQRQELEKRLEQEHEERIKQFTERLKQQLPALIKDVTGKSIPLKDHEQLVLDRLVQLKQLEL